MSLTCSNANAIYSINQIDAIQEVSEINMGKLIFYVLIALLIYWIIKSRRPKQEVHEASSEAVEDMVNCAQCGVYLPKSEAIHSHTKYFCSHEHCNLYIKSST